VRGLSGDRPDRCGHPVCNRDSHRGSGERPRPLRDGMGASEREPRPMRTHGTLRVTVVHLVLLALGGWSVWAQFVYRTPSRYLALVLVGAAAASTGLTLVFWLHTLLRGAGARDEQLSLLAVGQKICALTTLGFCFYSLFLFTNAKFDLADA